MTANINASDNGESCPSFEECLNQLQQIVAQLEDGSLGLEASMRQFEKGVSLLRSCYQTLEQAEQKIEILTGLDAAGNPVTAPFDATSTIDQAKTSGRRRGANKKQENRESAAEQPGHDDAEGTLF